MAPLPINKQSELLIKTFERLRLVTYDDGFGKLTIGWGHTGPDVTAGKKITPDEADALFAADVQHVVDGLRNLVKVKVNENELGALVSLGFNAGLTDLATSTLLHLLNADLRMAASKQFALWDHSGKVEVVGLLRRRYMEAALFLTPC